MKEGVHVPLAWRPRQRSCAACRRVSRPNSKVIDRFDFIHLVTDGDCVFVTYEGRNTDGRRFRNTEILTIRDQQIVDVEVYFGWSVPHRAPPGGFVDETGPQ